MKKRILIISILMIFAQSTAYAMHIAEGFLTPWWCIVYYLICLPFVFLGFRDIRKKIKKNSDIKMLLGLAAAYCFMLSALKLPSVAGSSAHPTGTGIGTILFGPFAMAVIGPLVLLFQALFLAHGGITTLGANTFSMAISGPIVSYIIYRLFKNVHKGFAVFMAAFAGDLVTYFVTSVQLALAYPLKDGGFIPALGKFASIFGITQIPVAILEGIATVIIFKLLEKYSSNEINILNEVV